MYTLNKPVVISKEQIAIRKKFLGATFVTCVVLSLLGGVIHVLELGENRMNQMRELAGFNLEDEAQKIRAAGEDFFINRKYENRIDESATYTVEAARALLTKEQWLEVETMQLIPAGVFTMGTDNKRSDVQNRPAHQIDLPAYEIDKYPVTNAEYAVFVASTGYIAPLHWKDGVIPQGTELHPVTLVSWFDAKKYAEWAGKRLPIEAEWEKAARGDDGRRWPWGNTMDAKKVNTYYNVGSTTPVGSYPEGVSPYGVMELAGSVSEWVANDFLPYSSSAAPENLFRAKVSQIPLNAGEREKRVVEFKETDERYKVRRGGSWKSDPFSTSSYHRNFSWPHYASDFFGFRCVKSVEL